MVRGVCAEHAPLAVVRRMEDDPKGYPTELWKQLGELGLLGPADPRGVRRLGAVAARGRDRLRGVRPRARALAPLRERGARRRRAPAPPASAQQKKDVAAEDRLGRGDPDARLARAAQRLRRRAACSSGPSAPGDGYRAHAARSATCPSRARRPACSCWRAPARRDSDVDLFLVDPTAAGRLARRSSEASPPTRSTRCASRRARRRARAGSARAGSGWATWDAVMHDGIILLAA